MTRRLRRGVPPLEDEALRSSRTDRAPDRSASGSATDLVGIRQFPEPIGVEVEDAPLLSDGRGSTVEQGVAGLVRIMAGRVGDAVHARRMGVQRGRPGLGTIVRKA